MKSNQQGQCHQFISIYNKRSFSRIRSLGLSFVHFLRFFSIVRHFFQAFHRETGVQFVQYDGSERMDNLKSGRLHRNLIMRTLQA